MTLEQPSRPTRENVVAALVRGARVALFGGAAVGALEAVKVLALHEVRYPRLAVAVVALAVAGYALAAIAVSLPSTLLALALRGRPTHLAAPASTCGGLGATAACAAFLATGAITLETLVFAGLAATLACLALRELLAWWPAIGRSRTWASLAGALLLCAAFMAAIEGSRPADKQPTKAPLNVLLVSIDTLRADHLGCYGAVSAQTPVIDALARESVVFEDATSQANTTGPSHTTMLTGLYPAEHGALRNGRKLSNRARTLADVLGTTHATGAFVSGFTLVDDSCGLAERFDEYDDDLLAWSWLPEAATDLRLFSSLIRAVEKRGRDVRRADRPAEEAVDSALAWLAERDAEPFFCFLHFYDPHAPYQPPARFAEQHGVEDMSDSNWYALDTSERDELVRDPERVQRMRALYSAEISYADEQLGRVLSFLRVRGELDSTLVVLTSDHGEGLGAHGYWFDHGSFLFDDELHVPLIVRWPGSEHAGARVASQVRLLDIAPTVLELAGLADALQTTGSSLVPLVDGRGDAHERPSFALATIDAEVSGFSTEGQRQALRVPGKKAIWTSPMWLDTQQIPEKWSVFDLRADPEEQRELDPDATAELQMLRTRLSEWRELTAQPASRDELDEAVLDQLRRLGY